MLQPVNQWRVHIGLHRTATTNLQDTLALVRDQLREHGVDYPTRAMLRETNLVDKYFRRSGLGALLPEVYYRAQFHTKLNRMRTGPTTLLFSEEQWVGKVRQIMDRPCYQQLDQRIAGLIRCIGTQNVTLFLSVREYSAIFSSAYSQALRMGNTFSKNYFGVACQKAVTEPPDWLNLVRRVKAAAPGVTLRIWTFEDYIRDCKPILDAYTGITLPSWPKLDAPESTRGISVETLQEIQQITTKVSKDTRHSIIRKLVALDKGTSKLDPFSAEAKVKLKARYAQDLQTIEQENPGIFIR